MMRAYPSSIWFISNLKKPIHISFNNKKFHIQIPTFHCLHQNDFPNTFHVALNSCSSFSDCRKLHGQLIKSGFHSNPYQNNCVVSMYAGSGLVEDARKLFDEMSDRKHSSSWNVMVSAYVKNGFYESALDFFRLMMQEGVNISQVSMVKALQASACLRSIRAGMEIHDYIVKTEVEVNGFIQTSLIDMYAKCGSLTISFKLFQGMMNKDLVSWNSLISGFVRSGYTRGGLKLFKEIKSTTRFVPNEVTLLSILPAFIDLGALDGLNSIHGYIIKVGFLSHVKVVNSLMAMYGKCNSVHDAFQLFMSMEMRNLVSWNSIIAIHTRNGFAEDAIHLFVEMTRGDIKPDQATIMSVLHASSNLATVRQSMAVHGYVIRSGFALDMHIRTALINTYSKSGSLNISHEIFYETSDPDVIAWTAMLAGYAMHGHGEEAIEHFDRMVISGITPDHVTFTHVLSACSHSGLITKGRDYFERMHKDYGIEARVDHYSCMVDLLGRSGLLDEAHELIKSMKIEPNAGVWGALLGACRMHRHIELGKEVAEKLFMLNPLDPRNYVILSNMYSSVGKWNDASKVRALMKLRGLKKDPGCSFIECGNKVHAFVVGDRSHPQSEEIYARLRILTTKMQEVGYAPMTEFVLHDVDEELKEDMLSHHSEKLAIVFGLLMMNDGRPIIITKNLRICGDCHIAAKFISVIEKRVIIIRDSKRFHHFVEGSCSCGDYW